MKKLFFILTAAFSFNLMAGTTLVCNDQNSHSVYKLQISNDSSRVEFTPLLKDSSALSKSVATLVYNEGESNETYSLYEGTNIDKNTIVVEIKNTELINNRIAELNVFYTKDNIKLDQKTIFLCSVSVNN